jgi:O-antigen ligase
MSRGAPESLRLPTGASPNRGAPTQAAALLILLAALGLPVIAMLSVLSGEELRMAAAVIAMIAGLVVFARPFWGLLIFVALVFIRPEETFPALAGLRLTLLVSSVTFLGMIFQALLNREKLKWTPLMTMIAGFFLSAVASTYREGNTVDAAMDIAKLVLMVLLILNLVKDEERLDQFVTSLIVFTGYIAVYSIFLYFTGHALDQHDTLRSTTSGIFGDPNDLAAMIVSGVALTIGRIVDRKGFSRFGYLLILGIMLAAIMLTHSRGGLLALLLVMGMFLLLSMKNKAIGLALAGVAVLALLFLARGRMTDFDAQDESANMRFWFWDNGFQLLLQNPVLGIGYGMFPDNNGGYTAHNTFVLAFGELGLIGYFFFIGAIYYCYRAWAPAWSTLPEVVDPEGQQKEEARRARHLLAARLSLLGFLAAGFFLSRTYVPVLYVLMSLPIAAQIALSNGRQLFARTGGERFADFVRIVALCVCSIGVIELIAIRMK